MDAIKHFEITQLNYSYIREIIGHDAKILKYSELSKYSNIDQLLTKPKDHCILLYELEEDSGHWVCLLKYDNKIEFMDPYGIKPDGELAWITKSAKEKLNEDKPLLTNLLNSANQHVIYNKTRFQSMSKEISTCGDHSTHRIYRLMHNDLDLDEYTSYMKHIKDEYGLTYDEIVAEFVSHFIYIFFICKYIYIRISPCHT